MVAGGPDLSDICQSLFTGKHHSIIPYAVFEDVIEYCQHRNFSDLTIIAIPRKFERYVFYTSLCYIQAGNKSGKIPGATIRKIDNLRKTL